MGCGGGGSQQDKLHTEGGWYEPKFGEGAQCHYCHVIIPKSHFDALPPKRIDEIEQLQTYPFPEDMTQTCVGGGGRGRSVRLRGSSMPEQPPLPRHLSPRPSHRRSRLACQVMLTPEMDGIVVYAPDGPPSIDI